MNVDTPLGERLRRLIAADGPISVAHYMAHCLGNPEHGYYRTRDPFGATGDFTTAPEISQMFGELIGLWTAAVWRQMGAPERIALIELGPGRGTLMADALRAVAVVPAFRQAVDVHLVETSPPLRDRQRAMLNERGRPLTWHDDLAQTPDSPSIVIANEFFDALPVFQAVRADDGWHERMVGLDHQGRLAFGLNPTVLSGFEHVLPPALAGAAPGAVYEWRAGTEAEKICRRLVAHGGAALIVDYGHTESGFGDTLQAVRAHRFVDLLSTPGEADLTAHVDFAALARAAKQSGIAAHGPMTQGDFLRCLGIEARAERLKHNAAPAQANAIDAALARLTGHGPGQMGAPFKALALAPSALGPLPGFDT